MSTEGPHRRDFVILCLLAAAGPVSAQTRAQPQHKADADRLGMTCPQILKMSSTQWITYFGETTKTDLSSSTVRAAAAYGTCYQARTDDLARALLGSGKGPSRATRTDFASFEAALRNFTAKALVDAEPPADPPKQALAALYQNQFRYEFYQEFQRKGATGPSAPRAPISGSSSEPPGKKSAPSSAGPSPSSARDDDQMTRAKNRFGELLGALPDDKLHELHGAFGEVLGLHALDEAMRLAVYRFAIFLLESSKEASSDPPPF
jgi:hypothetical protein